MLQDYYILLYNATALWLTIGLIWVVMGCYGRKSKFADEGKQALYFDRDSVNI